MGNQRSAPVSNPRSGPTSNQPRTTGTGGTGPKSTTRSVKLGDRFLSRSKASERSATAPGSTSGNDRGQSRSEERSGKALNLDQSKNVLEGDDLIDPLSTESSKAQPQPNPKSQPQSRSQPNSQPQSQPQVLSQPPTQSSAPIEGGPGATTSKTAGQSGAKAPTGSNPPSSRLSDRKGKGKAPASRFELSQGDSGPSDSRQAQSFIESIRFGSRARQPSPTDTPQAIDTSSTADHNPRNRRPLVNELRSVTPPKPQHNKPSGFRRLLAKLNLIEIDPWKPETMANLNAIKQYSLIKGSPTILIEAGVVLTYNPKFIVVFDKYPKSIYHFLVIPRIPYPGLPNLRAEDIVDLTTFLLNGGSARQTLVRDIEEMTEDVLEMIRDEMKKTEGFEWGIHVGFHAVPSMPHLHLHVISEDLISGSMKTKKHFNSFVPDVGFFVTLSSLKGMLEHGNQQAIQERVSYMKASKDLLRVTLECPKCDMAFDNMPQMKKHLEEEFEKMKAEQTDPRTIAERESRF